MLNFVGTNHGIVSDLEVIAVSLDDAGILSIHMPSTAIAPREKAIVAEGGPALTMAGFVKIGSSIQTGTRPVDGIT